MNILVSHLANNFRLFLDKLDFLTWRNGIIWKQKQLLAVCKINQSSLASGKKVRKVEAEICEDIQENLTQFNLVT